MGNRVFYPRNFVTTPGTLTTHRTLPEPANILHTILLKSGHRLLTREGVVSKPQKQTALPHICEGRERDTQT